MNQVLKLFLSMSCSGSLLILGIFLVKRFLKHKISRQWQYYIWLIVILRLLLPFSPEKSLLGNTYQMLEQALSQCALFPWQQDLQGSPESSSAPAMDSYQGLGTLGSPFGWAANAGQSSGNRQPEGSGGSSAKQEKETGNPMEDLAENRPFADIAPSLANNLWLVWLVAALGILIRKATIYQSFLRYVNAESTPVSDIEILDRLCIAAGQAGVKKPVELWSNPLVSSPLLLGLFRPCIVLPSVNIPEEDFQYIIWHELTHYRRRDMLYKWLVQVTACLHWFNPLVYLMGQEIAKACEFSCDEAVLAKIGHSNAQGYGKTLLDAMASVGAYKESTDAVTLSGNKQLLKERLGAIMSFQKKSKTATVLTGILTVCMAFGASFLGVYPVAAAETSSKESAHSASVLEAVPVSFADGNSFSLTEKAGKLDDWDDWEDDWDDWEDDWDDWEDDWDDWEDDWDDWEDDWEQLEEEYAAHGVTMDGKSYYYYQGKLVNIFLDKRTKNGYVLNVNPKGTINIKIVRSKDGKIAGVSYMSEAEVEELWGKLYGSPEKAGSCQYKATGASTATLTKLLDKKTKSVTIPKTVKIGGKTYKVTAIGKDAFKNSKKITSIVIGDNVKTIGASAFEGCTNLGKATLGKNVTEVGSSSFKNCKKLGVITITSAKLKKVGKNALKGIKSTAKVKVPAKKLSAYKKLFQNKGQGKKVKLVK